MWNILHRYNSLVAVGIAKPLVCPDCQFTLTTYIADDDIDTPAFWCVLCNTRLRFGSDTWDQIRSVVMEHFEED